MKNLIKIKKKNTNNYFKLQQNKIINKFQLINDEN